MKIYVEQKMETEKLRQIFKTMEPILPDLEIIFQTKIIQQNMKLHKVKENLQYEMGKIKGWEEALNFIKLLVGGKNE